MTNTTMTKDEREAFLAMPWGAVVNVHPERWLTIDYSKIGPQN